MFILDCMQLLPPILLRLDIRFMFASKTPNNQTCQKDFIVKVDMFIVSTKNYKCTTVHIILLVYNRERERDPRKTNNF